MANENEDWTGFAAVILGVMLFAAGGGEISKLQKENNVIERGSTLKKNPFVVTDKRFNANTLQEGIVITEKVIEDKKIMVASILEKGDRLLQ